MALNIISNFGANVANRNLSISDREATRSVAKLSSGLRVLSARDDAASLAIGYRLRSEVVALKQASVNAGQASSMLQIADGALGMIGNILVRMKALSVQAGSQNLGASERSALQLEFAALQSEIDRIARDTEFNGIRMIDGEIKTTTRIGDDKASPALAPGLRHIETVIGPEEGIESVSFSSDFDSTLIDISYATEGDFGVFTVTDYSQEVGSPGRTATGTTSLGDEIGDRNEVVSVVFDKGGTNERTVTITLNRDFNKQEFTTASPLTVSGGVIATVTTPNIANVGGANTAYTVTSFGGHLAGLDTQIVADSVSSPITASILRIGNQNGDDLVAETTVDFTSTAEQNVRLSNDQGDFVNLTIELNAALTATNYSDLQDRDNDGARLNITGLNGAGNDLQTGLYTSTDAAFTANNTLANLVSRGLVSVREIGGSASNSTATVSYNGTDGEFTVTVGRDSETGTLSGRNGEAGSTRISIGGRAFEITVAADFDRNTGTADVAAQEVNADVGGFDGVEAGDTDLTLTVVGYSLAEDQTLENLQTELAAAATFTITGVNSDDADATLAIAFGNFEGAVTILSQGQTRLTLTHDNSDNTVEVIIDNQTGADIDHDAAAGGDDSNLGNGETITVNNANASFQNGVFGVAGGTSQASFDIARVVGDLSGLDNRVRLFKGGLGDELTGASLSIANANTERGDLVGEIDLTASGPQTVTLKNGAGDSVELVFQRGAGEFTTDQLDLKNTYRESYFLIGQLGSSALYTRAQEDKSLFTFKIGTGATQADDVTLEVGAANTQALGVSATGPGAIRVDGDGVAEANAASAALQSAIANLSEARAIVGAGQNRLQFAADNLATAIENAEAARSTLLDLDVASEITVYTSRQILVQTGISVLAQANQQPQQLLRLFQ